MYARFFYGREKDDTLIITEGFKACLWMIQAGFWNTVALMGSSISRKQLTLIRRLDVRIVLFLDLDTAGKEGTAKIGCQLYKNNPGVFVAKYPSGYGSGLQPDGLNLQQLITAISEASIYPHWRKEYELQR